ncbi:MAG: class I SAM-dependent methyltransferase [Acidimicrobiales bacterium]
MPILPPGGSPRSRPEPHRARQIAESFGADAKRYDRTRPPYPDALVARIVAAMPGPEVLDVGCGTGIEGRQFQAAGATVLGIEPDGRMADLARARGLEVEVATFETWEPGERSFDAVIAGQSWHWVDSASGPSKAAEVLRPGGRLAVFGHVFDPPPEVAEALAASLRRVTPDAPVAGPGQALKLYQAMFANFAERIRAEEGFSEPEQWSFEWEKSYTRDEWLDLLPTTGSLTRLPSDKLAEVLDGVGKAIDDIGGHFTMTYTTLATTAARTSSDQT